VTASPLHVVQIPSENEFLGESEIGCT
jgi:hypothetical protein